MRWFRPVWFDQGLRFSCQRCHQCCGERGDHRWVYVGDSELEAVAEALRSSFHEVDRDLCTTHHGRRVLRFEAGRCLLHDGERCTVYQARPVQCSTWPFWPENVYSPRAWRKRGSLCPGIGLGQLWSREEVESRARRLRQVDEER